MLSKFLQDSRKESGLSQRQVANRLGYSTPQFISNWERGISNPPIDAIKQLGALYKKSPDVIFESMLKAEVSQLERDLRRKFNRSKKAA